MTTRATGFIARTIARTASRPIRTPRTAPARANLVHFITQRAPLLLLRIVRPRCSSCEGAKELLGGPDESRVGVGRGFTHTTSKMIMCIPPEIPGIPGIPRIRASQPSANLARPQAPGGGLPGLSRVLFRFNKETRAS